MPESYNAANVKCPFYRKDKPNYIVCEGIQDNTRINFWFASNKSRVDFMKKHCFKIKNQCPISKMLAELSKSSK